MGRHVVLVPGFGGFDALGSVRYYPQITTTLAAWQAQNPAQRLQLHYFDNLPTAGVETRADRLLNFLVSLVRTQVIAREGDVVTLVGHSTGGLDIRAVVKRLQKDLKAELRTPDDAVPKLPGDPSIVLALDILKLIRGMVFLSVPQQGTNIANWVKEHTYLRTVLLGWAWPLTWLSRTFTPRWAVGKLLELSKNGVALGLRDTLREMDSRNVTPKGDKIQLAGRLEARNEVRMFLDNIQSDFGAIDDLAHVRDRNARPGAEAGTSKKWISPAHLNDKDLADEKEGWRETAIPGHSIRTLSFATIGSRPYSYDETALAPSLRLWKIWQLPGFLLRTGWPDGFYLGAYSACATGDFVGQGVPKVCRFRNIETDATVERFIARWDNDGIVNTASMLWPDGENTYLVAGDHGDIIGHWSFQENQLPPPPSAQQGVAGDEPGSPGDSRSFIDVAGASARTYGVYDIFDSIGEQVSEPEREKAREALGEAYRRTWGRVFDFAVSDQLVAPPEPIAPV